MESVQSGLPSSLFGEKKTHLVLDDFRDVSMEIATLFRFHHVTCDDVDRVPAQGQMSAVLLQFVPYSCRGVTAKPEEGHDE